MEYGFRSWPEAGADGFRKCPYCGCNRCYRPRIGGSDLPPRRTRDPDERIEESKQDPELMHLLAHLPTRFSG